MQKAIYHVYNLKENIEKREYVWLKFHVLQAPHSHSLRASKPCYVVRPLSLTISYSETGEENVISQY